MKILVLCVVVSAFVAVSLAGPVKLNRVKDTEADSSSSESSESFVKKFDNTEDSSSESVEDKTVVVKDNDNNAKEVESSEEEEERKDKKKSQRKNNNIVRDHSGDESSDSSENDVKTKEYVLMVDEDLNADIRHKRAIRPDADTHNHILSNDLARMENEKSLKLKRARRDASSEEDSSEEKHKHKDGEVVLAAKPATAEASTLEGHAVVSEKPAEAEASSPTEETATALRRRRSTASSEESSEEANPEGSLKSRRRRNTSASSEENSSEEKGKTGDAAEAGKDADATTHTHEHEHEEGAATETKHEEPAETKHEEPAARRRRDISMESSEEDLKQEVADDKLDDYEEIIISLSGEEKEQPTLQDTSTNVENGKYFVLVKDPLGDEDVQNENVDIKSKSADKDNSDEDYVKGCEGNDATNDSSEWNETTYVE